MIKPWFALFKSKYCEASLIQHQILIVCDGSSDFPTRTLDHGDKITIVHFTISKANKALANFIPTVENRKHILISKNIGSVLVQII